MTKDKAQLPDKIAPEWSVLVEVDPITSAGDKMKIEADAPERKALAKRLALVSIESLKADVKLKRDSASGSIHVRGKINAALTQSCVITGEPVTDKLVEEFDAWFADKSKALSFTKARNEKLKKLSGAEMPILEENEDPEPIIDGKIDIGELTVQYLSLAINPYPHSEGAVFPVIAGDPAKEPDSTYKNPFAALKDWKAKLDTENS